MVLGFEPGPACDRPAAQHEPADHLPRRQPSGKDSQPLKHPPLNAVKNVTSQSNENYSLVILEYQDDTDMDSAMVKASTAVNQLSDSLPDMASTPTLMEMSPDMMATQYVAVDYEGMDIYELSDYVEDTIVPQLERVDGVASVSTTGLVKKISADHAGPGQN